MLFSLPYSADCIFVPFVCNLFSWNTTPAEGEPASTHSNLYLHWLAASSDLIYCDHPATFLEEISTWTRYVRLSSWLEQLNKLIAYFFNCVLMNSTFWLLQETMSSDSLLSKVVREQETAFWYLQSLQGWPLKNNWGRALRHWWTVHYNFREVWQKCQRVMVE